MKKVCFAVLMAAMFVFGLVGCAGSSLVGKWELDWNSSTASTGTVTVTFFSDGTFITDYNSNSREWKVIGDELYLVGTSGDFDLMSSYKYKVSGSTLTLTEEDGRSLKFKKSNGN